LVLGDNIFYGAGLPEVLAQAQRKLDGCVLFAYRVNDPQRYGVVELGPDGRVISIEEKPQKPKSNLAVSGLYLYDNQVCEIAAGLKPSRRGELEITDLNRIYIERGRASIEVLGRGYAWLDTGTHESMLEASQFVQVLEQRQNTSIACIEEIAWRKSFIDDAALSRLAEAHGKSSYGEYLRNCVSEGK
jgi:glucose-1-phosphate thymidylyltransferase